MKARNSGGLLQQIFAGNVFVLTILVVLWPKPREPEAVRIVLVLLSWR